MSERLVLDTSGNVSGRQAHLPFGEDFGESGTQEKHHFTSYERDNESGTDYAVNRQYSQGIGKFNRVDPRASSGKKEAPQTWNRYGYANSDPNNMKDPMGLFEGTIDDPFPPDPCSLGGASVIWDGLAFDPNLMCPVFDPLPPAPQNPIRPYSCQMDLNTQKGNGVAGQYMVGSRPPLGLVNPNTTNIGGHHEPGTDGNSYWFYLYEVLVSPVDDPSTKWTPWQWVAFTGNITVQAPDGTPVRVRLPDQNEPDNPFGPNIGIDPGPYGVRWIDSPFLLDKKVVGADLTWTFQFKGIAPDGTTGCGGGFTLHLTFGPGDDPNNAWSITDKYTY